jgi:nicotinamidase-related amidase
VKALLIIDVQEAYIGERREEPQYQTIMAGINSAAAQFRRNHAPVVVVRDLSAGDDGRFDNVRELIVKDSDYKILKLYNNSFWKTELDELFKSLSVDWLLLCGNAAEFCVDATYFGALERGYETYILRDAVFAETDIGLAAMEAVRPMFLQPDLQTLFTE